MHESSGIHLSSDPSTSRMRLKLRSPASLNYKFGVSDRVTAAIAFRVLNDLKMISEKDTSLMIGKTG